LFGFVIFGFRIRERPGPEFLVAVGDWLARIEIGIFFWNVDALRYDANEGRCAGAYTDDRLDGGRNFLNIYTR